MQKLRLYRQYSQSRSSLDKTVSYSSTLQLPKTSFKPKVPTNEEREELINITSAQLYDWQKRRERFSKKFTLHDGPPYANGDLHLGHALNKVLKDIINRFELIYHDSKVDYRPGWDCHGLPIEMKALKGVKNAQELSAVEIRKLCRSLASSMVDKQLSQFLDFAIMTDFTDPYITMSHEYEVDQLKIFGLLMANGMLSRQLKPVWWGCETQTALAEAELEYNAEHRSTAAYIKFPLMESDALTLFEAKYPQIRKYNLNLLIWTSTLWTLPVNKAICVNSALDYTIIYNEEDNEALIVASNLAEYLMSLNGSYKPHKARFAGKELIGMKYFNPAAKDTRTYSVYHGDHVTSAAGSGLVHTAPAHGGEDYLVGKQNDLEITSIASGKGEFIADNLPKGFQMLKGKKVTERESIRMCVDILKESDMIFHVDSKYQHSYPYDWRSHKPVIQRATPQWFVNVHKIKDTAIEALEKVDFIPKIGKNRLSSFIKNRNEWCISRQRNWGVPLPIVYSKSNGDAVEDVNVVDHIIKKMGEKGTDAWFEEEEDISFWLPEILGDDRGRIYYKSKDTMDVWFDSGTSWSTLEKRNDDVTKCEPEADVYLEGSDQHRGWFQSSLLNRIIATGENSQFKPLPPYKKIITHGFILDKQSDKMSKSKGNVISPLQVIKGGGKPTLPSLGTDGLRLWVASSDYTGDVAVTPEVLSRVHENIKKLRVTFKYMLGNLRDFNSPVIYEDLNPLDKYALSRLYQVQQNCVGFYSEHNFGRVVRELNTHMSSELSALYFDVCKECLYTDHKDSHNRRSIQTVLEIILRTYVGLLSPIQPMMTQEVWNEYRKLTGMDVVSPFGMGEWASFYELPSSYVAPDLESDFAVIWRIRSAVYKAIETHRAQGMFNNKLELSINITLDKSSNVNDLFLQHEPFLADYFLVSETLINAPTTNKDAIETSLNIKGIVVNIAIAPSNKAKCPRCWKHISETEDSLCQKCHSVLEAS